MKTLKMQIEHTSTEKKEINVKLPYFSKGINSFYRVSENQKCVEVQIYEVSNDATIQQRALSTAFGSETKESNEQEFNNAFERATQMLKNF